jgi:Na+-driven multidrug efflux pump
MSCGSNSSNALSVNLGVAQARGKSGESGARSAMRPERAERAVWLTWLLNMGFLGIVSIAYIVRNEALMRIFTRDSALISAGAGCIRIVA